MTVFFTAEARRTLSYVEKPGFLPVFLCAPLRTLRLCGES